jgi:CMP-N-acetylneuraminic acid synthetase
MTKLLGIIPARAGSKGIPHKNTTAVGGVPLVQYTLEAACSTAIFDEIVVTTDSPGVARIAANFPVRVIERPVTLATDDARMEDVVVDVLRGSRDATAFVLLQPTSPLRTSHHITEAWHMFRERPVGSVVSVCELSHHPYKSLTLAGDMLSPAFGSDYLSMPRQRLPLCVRQNGAIYICDVVAFERERRFVVAPSRAYVMTERDSIDIDNHEDIRRAEAILGGPANEAFVPIEHHGAPHAVDV